MDTCPVASTPRKSSIRRWILAALGVVCVGLAAIGVFVPGMPTTVFLIVASILFTKSCPWLEERLIRVRLFRPYLRYLDGEAGMPRRAKVSAIALMWTAVSVSSVVLAMAGAAWWVIAIVVLAAAVGTVAIVRLRGSVPAH